ncbi:MAG: hypothetical protein JSR80_04605 [Verrucomicrobia bacterium]|nr:hypothetical protein [Verrucomicrobiota bacterium]
MGKILKWYTPSHGAIMGAFSGAVGFSATRIFGNQRAYLQQLTENNANNQTRQIEEASGTLFNIGALGAFAYVAAPFAAQWFQKPTDLRLAFRFHLSSSLIGHFAFSQLQKAFFVRMSENGRGVWLENWAEQEWLTRTPSNLPSVNAKIRWENFTRVPKTITLDEKTPNSTASQWATLCRKINWGGRAPPFSTIGNALQSIDREAVTDTTYRYTQNLLAQLYLRIA